MDDNGRGRTIAVIDSGVGGLSVLRALLQELPQARFVYAADRAFAPYGEKAPEAVTERVLRIAERLRNDHRADVLVIACNTATAMAVDRVRREHPDWPVVGVEPALKPAAQLSPTGRIGVLATRGTVSSARFAQLRERVQQASNRPLDIRVQACDGLADAIEQGDTERTALLCARYLAALEASTGSHAAASTSAASAAIDTLVLGCTHYPFAADVLSAHLGPGVALVESGPAVARRTRAVLPAARQSEGEDTPSTSPECLLLCTANPAHLARAAQHWLGLNAPAQRLPIGDDLAGDSAKGATQG